MEKNYYRKIIGVKCYLSPMLLSDAEQYTEWLNDFAVSSHSIGISNILTIEKEINILKDLANGHNFAIIDKEKDKLIGSIGLFNVDFIHRRSEFGIIIGDRNYWNRGYGAEACKLMLDYCFNALNLHHIRLSTYSYNTRAIKCYEKVGFKVVGKFTEFVQVAGKKYDMVLMEILSTGFVSPFIEKFLDNVILEKQSNNLELL